MTYTVVAYLTNLFQQRIWFISNVKSVCEIDYSILLNEESLKRAANDKIPGALIEWFWHLQVSL